MADQHAVHKDLTAGSGCPFAATWSPHHSEATEPEADARYERLLP